MLRTCGTSDAFIADNAGSHVIGHIVHKTPRPELVLRSAISSKTVAIMMAIANDLIADFRSSRNTIEDDAGLLACVVCLLTR